MQAFRLDGSTAVITGAGSGMGRATATLFAVAGASRLILAGRRQEKLNETASLISAVTKSCQVVVVATDIAEAAGRRLLVAAAGDSVDFLINNAGLFQGAALNETSDELWEKTFALNSLAPMALTRDFQSLLEKSRRAAVVNISSTIAVKPISNAAAYNSSKAALIQLTRSLALELGAKKIRVNCILPAVVETDMYRGRFSTEKEYHEVIANMASQHPLLRVGTAEDIANAVVFLCSEAASWVTGVALPVDGGMLCT